MGRGGQVVQEMGWRLGWEGCVIWKCKKEGSGGVRGGG